MEEDAEGNAQAAGTAMSIRHRCPVCGFRIKVPDQCAGRRGACPNCKLMIRLPTAQELSRREIPPAYPDQIKQTEPEATPETRAEPFD